MGILDPLLYGSKASLVVQRVSPIDDGVLTQLPPAMLLSSVGIGVVKECDELNVDTVPRRGSVCWTSSHRHEFRRGLP